MARLRHLRDPTGVAELRRAGRAHPAQRAESDTGARCWGSNSAGSPPSLL